MKVAAMSKLHTIISVLCVVVSLEARADKSLCDQSDAAGLEILKDMPANVVPRRDDVFAVIGRKSNAETLACAKRLDGSRNPQPWARITVYFKPEQAIPGLCRLPTRRYSLSNGKWERELAREDPGYAVALTQRKCSNVDATGATTVASSVEDFTMLRILRYAIESGPLHKVPSSIGTEWRGNRVYFGLYYQQAGCTTKVLLVSGTATGGFEVAEEGVIVC
jgi:hypothetical protein